MILLTIIIFICTLLYLLSSVVFYFVLNNLDEDKIDESASNSISIIIAAKNEEDSLDKLFNSLSSLNYPSNKHEIILVNDNSSDNTFKLAKEQSALLDNTIVINAEEAEGLQAKRAALATGIKKARFDNIVITDADCIVSPNWLKYYSEAFKKHDFIIGIAPLMNKGGLPGLISTFENLRNHILVFVFTKLGIPYSASARNFGFRKAGYEEVGGYKTSSESLSGDDDLLLREAIKAKMKIGLLNSPFASVYSNSKSSFREYLKQRARHTSASHYYLPGRKLILSLWHLINLLIVFSFILSFFSSIFVLPVLVKLIIDYIVMNNFQQYFGYNFNPFEIIILTVVCEFLIPVHFINSFRFKNRWS